jgi:hypothetical protein
VGRNRRRPSPLFLGSWPPVLAPSSENIELEPSHFKISSEALSLPDLTAKRSGSNDCPDHQGQVAVGSVNLVPLRRIPNVVLHIEEDHGRGRSRHDIEDDRAAIWRGDSERPEGPAVGERFAMRALLDRAGAS